jgi:hypothetical protein
MSAVLERKIIRRLHLVLSIPVIGYIYGPVAKIPPAVAFTRFVAMPLIIVSGLWLWQGHRIKAALRRGRAAEPTGKTGSANT